MNKVVARQSIGRFVPYFILVGALLPLSSFSSIMDRHVFNWPLQRMFTADQERVQDVRIIVFDDATLQKVGRPFKLRDWLQITQLLKQTGVNRVLLHDILDQDDLQFPPGGGEETDLIVGTSTAKSGRNPRVMASKDLNRVQLHKGSAAHLEQASHLIWSRGQRHQIGRFGHINLIDKDQTHLAYGTKNGVLPHLALYSLPVSEWDYHLWSKRIQGADSGPVSVHFLRPRDLAEVSLPARVFLENGHVRKQLPRWLKDDFHGVDLVLLVPSAFSGSRTIESPFGKVPSYMLTASLMQNLKRKFVVHSPLPPWIWIALVASLMCTTAHLLTFRRFMGFVFGLLLWGLLAASWLYVTQGIVLPMSALVLLVTGVFALRWAYEYGGALARSDKLKYDLMLGQQVQQLFVPTHMTGKMGLWEYSFAFQPAGSMSGDWLHVIENQTNHGPVGILAIGDVVGKGPSAALMTATIASVWAMEEKKWPTHGFQLEQFLDRLNRTLFTTFNGQQNTTLLIAVLHESKVTISRFGAHQWIRFDSQGAHLPVRSSANDVLGFSADLAFRSMDLAMETGEILCAYTDGVMDGSRSRRHFLKNIRGAGFPDDSPWPYLEREAHQARLVENKDLDDFTMMMIRRAA